MVVKRSSKKRGRGRGRGSRRGGRRGSRRGGYGGVRKKRTSYKTSPYKSVVTKGTTQVSVSNLHHEVTEADIREIFSKVGKVKKVVVHYNSNGKSRGTAQVHFMNKAHALKAVEEYNQAKVDGRSMYVRAVATLSAEAAKKTLTKTTKKKTQVKKKSTKKKTVEKKRSQSRGKRGRGRGRSRGRGRRGRSRGRGRGRGRGRSKSKRSNPKVTAEQLDKEMEDYHNQGANAGGDGGGGTTVDQIAAGQPDTSKLYANGGAEE